MDVTDTTVAGDVFTASVIHTWVLDDLPLEEAGRFASALGALNCSRDRCARGVADIR